MNMGGSAWWAVALWAAGGALAAVGVGLALQTEAGRELLVSWGLRLAGVLLSKIEGWLMAQYVRSGPGPTRGTTADGPAAARLREQIQSVRGARKMLVAVDAARAAAAPRGAR